GYGHDREADGRRLERWSAVDLAAADDPVSIAWSRTFRAQLTDHGVVAALDTDRLVATGARQTGHPIGVSIADGYGRLLGLHVDRKLPIGTRYSDAAAYPTFSAAHLW
ncbi:MAG: hypothetical protein WBP49_01140, partial [Acidimicrobiia bacterium]